MKSNSLAVGTRGPGTHARLTRAILRLGAGKAPDWLPKLAEWTTGIHIIEDDVPADTGRAYDIGTLKFLRQDPAAAPRDDFTRWGLWFLGDHEQRPPFAGPEAHEP